MKSKLYNFYLLTMSIILAALIVFSYSSSSVESSFALGSKICYWILLIFPSVVGLLMCFDSDVGISMKETIFYSVLLILAIINMRVTHSITILQIVIFSFGLRRMEFKKIVKMFYLSFILSTGFIMLGRILGVFKSISYDTELSGLKESFGFILPNTAGIVFLAIIIITLYLNNKNWNLKEIFFLIVMSVLLFTTGARTSELLMILAIFMYLLLKNHFINNFVSKHLIGIIMMVLIFSILFSYITSLMMQYTDYNSIIYKLDYLLSGRLRLGSQFIQMYGVTFWGQNVIYTLVDSNQRWWSIAQTMWLDNSYLKVIVNYGFIWLIIFSIGMFNVSKKAKYAGDTYVVIPIVIMLLLGISEATALSSWYDFVLFSLVSEFNSTQIHQRRRIKNILISS